MMKKRASESSGMEDMERSLHVSFSSAANSISHLYTQALHQQRVAFQAGQSHSLEKIFEVIHIHHLAGTTPTTLDILNYLKNELGSLAQAEMTIAQVQSHPIEQSSSSSPFGRADWWPWRSRSWGQHS